MSDQTVSDQDATLVLGGRYNGPPGTGNGGYSAGRFSLAAGLATDTPEVTLRKRPPLDVELRVESGTDGVTFWHGADLIAEVRPGRLGPDELVEAVSWDEAAQAAASSPALTLNPFPTCYVCGVERADGMRLFPGRLSGRRTATPWTAPAEISAELVWAALDCPGGWAAPMDGQPHVLGRITGRVLALPEPGEHCVIMGALSGEEGRKSFVLTTVYGEHGTLLAHARAIWLVVP